ADKPTVQDFFDRLLADPRMGELYATMLADFKANGGTEFVAFNDVSRASDSGSYGALGSIYDDGSQRYDALVAAAKADIFSTQPSTGVDHIVMAAQGGTTNALAGDDVITAGAGNDTIDGGDGNDSIVGSSSSIDARGHLIETDQYDGGTGADTITGGIGNDHIYGNESTSVAGAVDGADSLSGGAGNDTINGNVGDDVLAGGDGNDFLSGDEGNDSVTGDAGNDNVQGGAGNDVLSGGADNDTLRGGTGDDTMNGGDGDDLLSGDSGHDLMTGGTGKDQFAFTAGQAAFTTAGASAYAIDEITDFTAGTDRLALGFHPAAILQGSAATVAAAATWAAQALQGHAGATDVAAVTVGGDTYLFYDDHAKGGALDAGIRLDHVVASGLSLTDFV
ncbi:MAG TPA: calcium-binding protein, partial [Sphingomonas sp.]|uniref:calcium-binding protein n=1 Tax=Sphingomonas sp. TaxID=28214 RepID=UPI002D0EED50